MKDMSDAVGKDDQVLRRLLDQNWCIWMTAGVISHKMCPLNYDCEHCEFDRVMRHKQTSPLKEDSCDVGNSDN